MHRDPARRTDPPKTPPRPLLHAVSKEPFRSWKEIAGFLGVTERSAQRWEKSSGLPVHRMGGSPRARIVAYPEELREWVAAGWPGEQIGPPAVPGRLLLPAAIVLGLAALLLGLWGVSFTLRSGVPRAWSLDDSLLTIVDERERVCWKKRFPKFNSLLNRSRHEIAVIADIDGDRRQDVLFNFFPQDQSRYRSALRCYDAKGGLRWEYRYGGPKTFGGRSFEPLYAGHFIRPVTFGGVRYVLAVANHYIWYPSQVSLLEAATGRLVEEYWHPGLIERFLLHDIDGDGADEAIFAAINNPGEGLGHSAVGVLALPFSKAARPALPPNDPFPPLTGGGEMAYVLFPLPDVNRALATLPAIAEFKIDDRRRILFETSLPENGGIVYYLDFKLKLVEARFSDNFGPLHDRLFRQRLLDHRLTPGERECLRTLASFPAAPDGNSPKLARFWKY